MVEGDRLGKYRFTRKLGQGGMGEVWAAVDETTQREVAIKLLLSAEERLRRRLLREGEACRRLDHENVVSIYDVGETPAGEPFLVMELLAGETLRQKMRREGPLAPEAVARLGAAMAKGLAAAHAVGVIHRDLKPENVFLERAGEGREPTVKLLDFGTSRLEVGSDGKLTATGAILGSPAYMSPEQATSAKDVGASSDLWSLGVVLFEMISGTRPFRAGTLPDLLMAVLKAPIPPLPAGTNAELAAVVQGCLQRDPARRTASAARVAEQLVACEGAAGRAIEAPAAPSSAPARQPPRFPTPGAPSTTVQTFRVPEGASAAPRASAPRPVTAAEIKPAARAPKALPDAPPAPSGGSPKAPWVVAIVALIGCALAVGMLLRRSDDTTPPPSKREAGRASRGADPSRRAEARDNPRDPGVDPPAAAPRAPRPGGAPKADEHDEEQRVSLIIDVEVPSQVYLDDRPVGNTPMDKLDVLPGTHRLVFKHATFGERRLTVDARLGVQVVIKVDFEAKEEPDAG